ncbi:putative regulatory protein, FmdB family [Burkholderiales bacterium JOSHI_001]|nr:putative regulatory protein, FmdB family [Burkholderiales bacterium JOSHI_001]
MPIYAYRCGACGHAKDVLQKLADPVLTTCPACGAEAFAKQLTAAGFQLKGSGWYATDFKGGSTPAAKPADGVSKDKPAETSTPAASSDSKPAASGGCGTGCACH